MPQIKSYLLRIYQRVRWGKMNGSTRRGLLIHARKRKMTIRTDVQERWEVQSLDWMQKKGTIFLNLSALGFIKTIQTQSKSPDVLCILGTTRKNMVVRIRYSERLMSAGLQTKTFVLFTGERSVKELSQIAKKFGIKIGKSLLKPI